jgi:hypothetical protein
MTRTAKMKKMETATSFLWRLSAFLRRPSLITILCLGLVIITGSLQCNKTAYYLVFVTIIAMSSIHHSSASLYVN